MNLKNLIRRILIVLFTIFLTHTVYSQENYLKGYVILKSGDTIHGFIDYRYWRINPDKIAFKEQLSDTITYYNPLNCKAFSVLDEKYESAIIPIEISSRNTTHLDNNPELNMRVDTTFLQTLMQGKKSLYYYINVFGNENFFIENDSAFILLIYKKYTKLEQMHNIANENKKFIGQLTIYLDDCKTIQPKLQKLEYRRKDLFKLFCSYYECIGSKIEFQKKLEKVTSEFGALAGISFTPEISSTSSYSSFHANSSVNMAVGLSLNLILPRTQKKWSIYNELIYSPYNRITHGVETKFENEYQITDYDAKSIRFYLNNMVRFQYPVKKAFVFADMGMSSAYGIQKVSYFRKEVVFHSINTVTEDYNYPNSPEMGFAFTYGLGLRYKGFSFETRAYKFSFSRFYFLLGYKF